MRDRSPVLVAVIAAIAVLMIFLVIGNGLMGAGFDARGISALAAVAAISVYLAERTRTRSAGAAIAGKRSPEIIALADGLIGAVLLLAIWALLGGEGFSWTTALIVAGLLFGQFYVWERERQYLIRGQFTYPLQWLNAERVLSAIVVAGILAAVFVARRQPGGLSSGDLRTIVIGAALLGAMSVLVSVSIRRERRRLTGSRPAPTGNTRRSEQ